MLKITGDFTCFAGKQTADEIAVDINLWLTAVETACRETVLRREIIAD